MIRLVTVLALVVLLQSPAKASRKPLAGKPAGSGIRIIAADTVDQGKTVQKLAGNVIVERSGIRLSAARMEFHRDEGMLRAWGTVEIREPSFLLTCAELTFSTKRDEAVAWGSPTLTQKETRDNVSYVSELSGVQIRIFSKEKRIQVLEKVVLTRYQTKGSEDRTVDLRVRCRSLDALSLAKRSAFKGDVSIETPTVGARGERGLFDQISGQFYILGNAQAWNYDRSGRKVNRIEGDKIVYFTRNKRTIVIGNVTADVEPEVDTGARRIPLHVEPVSRPGEVMPDE